MHVLCGVRRFDPIRHKLFNVLSPQVSNQDLSERQRLARDHSRFKKALDNARLCVLRTFVKLLPFERVL